MADKTAAIDALSLSVKRLLDAGQWETAWPLVEMLVEMAPDSESAIQFLALTAIRTDKFERGVDLFERLSKNTTRSPAFLQHWALMLGFLQPTETSRLDAFLGCLGENGINDWPVARARKLMDYLRFDQNADPRWNERLFEHLVHPLLTRAIQRDEFNLALKLEGFIYEKFVKQTETDAHYRAVTSTWSEAMREGGRRMAASLPASRPPRPGPVWQIGLVIHAESMLAHVEVMLGMLEGFARLAEKELRFTVYALAGRNDGLRARLADLGVRLVNIGELFSGLEGQMLGRLTRLRERLAADQVHAMVWMSSTVNMAFAFALRLAPVQIWFAMKYHSDAFPEIDGYVTGASFARFVEIDGRRWRSARSQVSARTRDGAEAEAAILRRQFGDAVVLGTLSREEKIASPAFLDAVCRILRNHPQAVYLWTGRNELTTVRARFEDAGVLAQTRYVGWIDTKVYVHVLDIFLDTFPAGCGFTVWESMAAGKPVAFMASDNQQKNISLDQLIWPLLNGADGMRVEDTGLAREILGTGSDSRYLRAANADDYVARVTRLIEDADWRRTVGAAGRDFVTKLMGNPEQTARDCREHFLEILHERYPRESAERELACPSPIP